MAKNFIDMGLVYVNLDNVVSIKFELDRIIFNYNSEISLDGGVSPDYTYINMPVGKERNDLIEILESKDFITFEKSDNSNTYVNLSNTSSIKEYIKERGSYTKRRLIFNLNVSSTLTGTNTITSNAVYYDFDTEEDFNEAASALQKILKSN